VTAGWIQAVHHGLNIVKKKCIIPFHFLPGQRQGETTRVVFSFTHGSAESFFWSLDR